MSSRRLSTDNQQHLETLVPASEDERPGMANPNMSNMESPTNRGNINPNGPTQQPGTGLDTAAQHYYTQLEQSGQLADVYEQTDLSKLPPRITHIRHADGTIERIGFS